MIECLNKECVDCKEGKCKDKEVISGELACCNNIKPNHTPSYAEEQLNHAIDKENRCYNEKCQYNNKSGLCEASNVGEYLLCEGKELERLKPINYEEEYHKLKKELKDIKHIYYNSDTSDIKEENKQLKERNKLLEEKDKEQEERIEIQKIRIRELTVENEGFRQGIEGYKERIKSYEKEINSLKLKAAVTEKLEIEINNLNEIVERKDKEIEMWINVSKEADREIAELKRVNSNQEEQIKSLGKSTNENYYNWIETQKKNEKLIYKNTKLSEKVEVLKEGNIKLLELL